MEAEEKLIDQHNKQEGITNVCKSMPINSVCFEAFQSINS